MALYNIEQVGIYLVITTYIHAFTYFVLIGLKTMMTAVRCVRFYSSSLRLKEYAVNVNYLNSSFIFSAQNGMN